MTGLKGTFQRQQPPLFHPDALTIDKHKHLGGNSTHVLNLKHSTPAIRSYKTHKASCCMTLRGGEHGRTAPH